MSQNNHYKQIFSQYSGYVYQFTNDVPEGQSPEEYITAEFVTESNNQTPAISVTQLPNSGSYIVHSFQDVASEKFVRLADLSYQEPLAELESETESESEPQGDQ